MQAAGILVIAVRELTAGVKFGQDKLDTAHALFFMDIDRHAAAVVFDLDRAVFVESEGQRFRVAGECFVDAVIDNLLHHMVRTRGIGIHAGALAHGIEP